MKAWIGLFGGVACAALILPRVADAQTMETPAPDGGGLPLAQAERPLTLTEGTLRGDLDVGILRLCVEGLGANVCDTAARIDAGAGYGITDDLEVGVQVFGLQLAPDAEYNNAPILYGRFRFLDGPVEVGAEASVAFRDFDPFGVAIGAGVPVFVHLGDQFAIRTGAGLTILAGDNIDTAVGLNIPVEFVASITPNIFASLRSGLTIGDLGDAGDTVAIPLALRAGYTIADGDAPLVDIYGQFGWPALYASGFENDKVLEDIWQVNIGAAVYLDIAG
ncbi:MAG: hypothetical protein AAGF12_23035 [Myxococcota bacterium]